MLRLLRVVAVAGIAMLPCMARAEEAPTPPSPQEAAKQAQEAIEKGDKAALEAIAARPEPDPWLVAHVLDIETPAAALPFARAVPAPVGPRLARYFTGRKGVPESREVWAALLRVEDDLEAERWETALGVIDGQDVQPRSILAVRSAVFRGRILDELRRPDAARVAWESAADTAAAIGWTAQEESALIAGGLSALAAWRLADVRRLYERLASLQEAGGDAKAAGKTIADLGSVASMTGDYAEARRRYEAALEKLAPVKDPVLVAGIRARLGAILTSLGEIPAAYAQLQAAIQSLESVEEGRDDLVDARAFLGNLYEGLGLIEASVGEHRKSLALAAAGEDPIARGVALGNLARALLFEDRLDESRAQFDEAAKQFEAGRDRLNLVRVQEGLSEVARAQRRFDEALAHDRAAIKGARDLGVWAETVDGLEGLARTHRLQGRVREALALYEEALTEAQRFEAADYISPVLAGIAVCQDALGQHVEAVRTARALVVQARSPHATRVDPIYRARRREGYAAGARSAARQGDVTALWTFLEAGRAQALLLSLGGRTAVAEVALPEGVRAAEAAALAEERAALERFRETIPQGDRRAIAASRAEVDAARAKVAAAAESVAALDRVRALGLGAAGRMTSLEDVRRRIAPDEALVLYGLVDPDAVAIVVTREQARLVPLGPAATIRERLDAFRPDDERAQAGDELAALRGLLVNPLGLTERQRRVTLAPDGPLAYAPLGGLFEDRDVSFVPSGSVYDLLLQDRARRGERRLAVGDPDYGRLAAQPSVALLRGGAGRLSRLPATAAEAKAVVRDPERDVLLTGAGATEAALREALAAAGKERWQVIHLACHGLIDRASPQLSALALTPDPQDDGLLMAREILRLRVSADLVVLSACETARDQVLEGEGLVGLAPAFLMAGSPRVVAGLWKVDDAATKALMDAFYKGWDEGKPATQALREAQAAVRAAPQWSHPRFWAPWVVWGLPD